MVGTYTGSGTVTDPWIVEDWDTFIRLATNSGNDNKHIRWAEILDKYIDFNEIKPDGYDDRFDINACVDFNGWTFRNLRVNNSSRGIFRRDQTRTYGEPDWYFKNATFENVYTPSTSFILWGGRSDGLIDNVSVTGRFSEEGIFIMFDGNNGTNSINCKLRRVSAVVEVGPKVTSVVCSRQMETDFSYFKMSYQGTGTMYPFRDGKSTNSLYKLKGSNAGGNMPNIDKLSSNSKSVTDVYIIETKSFNTIAQCDYLTSIINNETAPVPETLPSGLIGCTTDQMKDSEYLKSIGFPIGEV